MGKRSQTWNKPLSRRMLEKQLNELVCMSMNKPVESVDVELVFGFDDPNALVVNFDGSDMKNNLFGYLMDKSLTSRIIDIYGCGMLDMMKIIITIQTFADCRALRKTNIDSRTMECLDKMRMKQFRKETMMEKCELCGSETNITKHHLIPVSQSRHKNKYLKTDEGNFLWVCTECHSQIHALFSNYELKTLYNTKDDLLDEPRMRKFVEWRRKHPDFKGSSKMAKERRPKR